MLTDDPIRDRTGNRAAALQLVSVTMTALGLDHDPDEDAPAPLDALQHRDAHMLVSSILRAGAMLRAELPGDMGDPLQLVDEGHADRAATFLLSHLT